MPKPQYRLTTLLTEQLKAERIQQVVEEMINLGLSGIQLLPDRVNFTFLTDEEARRLLGRGLDPVADFEKVA